MESHHTPEGLLPRRERQRRTRARLWNAAVWIVIATAFVGFLVAGIWSPPWLTSWWGFLLIPWLIGVGAILFFASRRFDI